MQSCWKIPVTIWLITFLTSTDCDQSLQRRASLVHLSSSSPCQSPKSSRCLVSLPASDQNITFPACIILCISRSFVRTRRLWKSTMTLWRPLMLCTSNIAQRRCYINNLFYKVMKVKSFSRVSSLSYLELRTQERGRRCCRICTTGTNPLSNDFESSPIIVFHIPAFQKHLSAACTSQKVRIQRRKSIIIAL